MGNAYTVPEVMQEVTPEMSAAATRCWIVRGRVQGVNYRAFAARHAARLDIAGYARNMPDGSVRVLASGSHASLAAFQRLLHQGPRRARVEDVSEIAPPGEPPTFSRRTFSIL